MIDLVKMESSRFHITIWNLAYLWLIDFDILVYPNLLQDVEICRRICCDDVEMIATSLILVAQLLESMCRMRLFGFSTILNSELSQTILNNVSDIYPEYLRCCKAHA